MPRIEGEVTRVNRDESISINIIEGNVTLVVGNDAADVLTITNATGQLELINEGGDSSFVEPSVTDATQVDQGNNNTVTDPNTLGTLKCGVVDCTSLKIGDTEFPANAASNSNQQILPANPQKGDMLFWNGSKWGLVKSESGSDGALLTLIDGVLMWKSYNIQADQIMRDLATGTNRTDQVNSIGNNWAAGAAEVAAAAAARREVEEAMARIRLSGTIRRGNATW